MAKQRPSLEAFAQAAPQAATTNVVELKPAEDPAQKRVVKPHTSLYLDKAVQKAIKEIALHYDRSPHDLYLEGIDLMLAKYGRPSITELGKK